MESLWVAKTGLEAQQTRMTIVSQNLANVNTTGYKRQRAMFEDLLYQNVVQAGALTSQQTEAATGLNIGTGVRVVATDRQFSQGNLVTTSNPASSRSCCRTARRPIRATARSRSTRTASS
jgi:flagellar basal-body rod protein FlgG